MLDGLNQSELLAFVEDALPSADAMDLRSRLAAYPDVLALVDDMRADRASLRRDVAPELRRDLVAELEPALSRAMLFEADNPAMPMHSRPGQYRAAHRRPRLYRFSRLLIAASFLFGTATALYLAAQVYLVPAINANQVAANDVDGERAATPMSPGEIAIAAPTPVHGGIHHWDAVEVPSYASTNDPRGELPHADLLELESGARAVASRFVLDLRAANSDAVVALLRDAVADAPSSAFVRNFTLAELNAAYAAASLAEHDRRAAERAATILASQDNHPLSLQERRAIQQAATGAALQLGELLAGANDGEPPAVQQFDYSGRGISHAITIPATRLLDMLEGLDRQFGTDVSLRALPAAGERESSAVAEPSDTWARWVAWQRAIESFTFTRDADGELMIVVPVAIDD